MVNLEEIVVGSAGFVFQNTR